MIGRIINLALDILIVVLLWFLTPLLIALFSPVMPVYGKIIGVFFMVLIAGAVIFYIAKSKRKNLQETA